MSLKNPVTPLGIDPGTVRLVAQRLNHYATPCPIFRKVHTNIVIGDSPKVLLTETPKILFSDFLQPVLVTWQTYESVRLEPQQSVSEIEGCTHSIRWVARATKFGEVAPNVRGSSV